MLCMHRLRHGITLRVPLSHTVHRARLLHLQDASRRREAPVMHRQEAMEAGLLASLHQERLLVRRGL
jgi:hypothetical protein